MIRLLRFLKFGIFNASEIPAMSDTASTQELPGGGVLKLRIRAFKLREAIWEINRRVQLKWFIDVDIPSNVRVCSDVQSLIFMTYSVSIVETESALYQLDIFQVINGFKERKNTNLAVPEDSVDLSAVIAPSDPLPLKTKQDCCVFLDCLRCNGDQAQRESGFAP